MRLIELPLMQWSVSLVLRGSAAALPARTDRQAATMPSGLTGGSAFVLMSRIAPGAHHPGTMTSGLSPSSAHQI